MKYRWSELSSTLFLFHIFGIFDYDSSLFFAKKKTRFAQGQAFICGVYRLFLTTKLEKGGGAALEGGHMP